jgi:hypothetical protein
MVIPEHVADLQVFMIHGVVRSHYSERRLMVKVGTLPTYLAMRFGEHFHRFTPAAASLLAARNTPLGELQFAFRLAIPARGKDARAVCKSGKRLKPQVYAGLLVGCGQQVNRRIGAGDTGVPAVDLSRDRDGLGSALKRAVQSNAYAPDLGQTEQITIQDHTAAILWVGEAVITAVSSEAWMARRFSSFHTAEESLKRLIQTAQHILQDLRIDLGILRTSGFGVWQLHRLLLVGSTLTLSALPPNLALFKGDIVEQLTTRQDHL